MKYYLIPLILASMLNAQTMLTSEMIYDSMGKAVSSLGAETASAFRRLSKTKTPKEKCITAWWDYFNYSSKKIYDLNKENISMKNILRKKLINYAVILKGKNRNIKVDINNLRKKSCSQEYFEQIIQKEKRIAEETNTNKILHRLMKARNLTLDKKHVY
ncbi:MAG: hypothetical protein Q9M36_13840 [Sulfurovum sp.]|nr:hypothetical protein [Sulfurovum sp.]